MAQHRYEIPVERRISKLEETLSTFIKESIRRQKESENLVWRLKKNYDKTFKEQASSIKNIESHLGRIAELIHGKGVGSLPSFTETNPRGLAHAITTRSGLDYNPPKNPLEETSDSQNTTTENIPTKERLSINIPFIKALQQMPKYAKFMKDLLAKKGKINEASRITLKECCSAVVLNKIPLTERDPESFTILCVIGKSGITTTGIAENVIVKIDKFISRVDFVFLDMEEDHKIPIILGRPFLATTHAMIDVFNKKISFEVGDETITFDIEKSMRFLPSNDDTCHSVDMVDLTILDHVQEILPSEPFDSFLFEPINHHLPTKFNNLWDDDEVEQDLTNQILHELKSDDYAKPTLFSANTFE
ncbi:putative reverse transcriptase domain-containing protein [Tanacetum coccineum]